MDVARPPKPRARRPIMLGAAAIVVVALIITSARIGPAIPTVEAAELVIDSVRIGELVREVRGSGNLAPEQMRWITAHASARVERILAESGEEVGAGHLLITMSNPDLQIQTLQAEQQVRQAQVELLNLRTSLRSGLLSQEGVVAEARTRFTRASQEAAAAEALQRQDLISRHDATSRAAEADEATIRLRVEEQRLQLFSQSIDSQVVVQEAQVRQLEAIAENQRTRLQSLQVRTPEAGVVRDLNLELGQWVPEGAALAKVIQPGRLKAVIRVPEALAADVLLGQRARVEWGDVTLRGHVVRKDPAAQQSTVTLDVALDDPLPRSAVPDLTIQATIELEHVANALIVGRPMLSSGAGRYSLFRLGEDGRTAIRVSVELGRGSTTLVDVRGGLAAGDQIILSDMSRFDAVDQVRIR